MLEAVSTSDQQDVRRRTGAPNSYGARPQPPSSPTAVRLEELRRQGFTVVEGLLSPERCADFSARLATVYQRQEEESGLELLRAIGELDVVRCPLAYDLEFLHLVQVPQVRVLVEALLGEFHVLHLQNGILNTPGEEHHQGAWHRDLPYQELESSAPLAISVLYALDPFTAENGATCVLPGSHRHETLPSEAYVEANEVAVDAPAGAALVFDSMLFHRAGHNRSPDVRCGINHVFARPFVAQQISLPDALEGVLSGDRPRDPHLQRVLGYRTPVARSVAEWRAQRARRLAERGPSDGAL